MNFLRHFSKSTSFQKSGNFYLGEKRQFLFWSYTSPFPAAIESMLQSAEEIKIAANTRYYLSEFDSVWMLKNNDGDIYAWEYENESFIPIFLKEVETGDLLFGVQSAAKKDAKVFFFITSKETTLYKITLTTLKELLNSDEEVRHWVASRLERCGGFSRLSFYR